MKSKLSTLMVFLARREALSFLPPAPSPSSPDPKQPQRRHDQRSKRRSSSVGYSLSLGGSSPAHRRRRRIGACYYTSRPESEASTKDKGESTFWYTVSRRNPSPSPSSNGHIGSTVATSSSSGSSAASDRGPPSLGCEDDDPSLPCVPTLDADGPLPPGAYVRPRTRRDSDSEAKPTCKISVALSGLHNEDDDSNNLDASMHVRGMHQYIDSGLTSFQLPCLLDEEQSPILWGLDAALYRDFLQQTPTSVLDRVKVTVPVPLSQVKSTKSARTIVMDLLMRYRTDALDEVQLVFHDDNNNNNNGVDGDGSPRDGSRNSRQQGGMRGGSRRRRSRSDLDASHLLRPGEEYWLDALDALRDLQREGYVRAVSTRNVPNDALWLAERCGLADAIGNDVSDGSLLWKPGARHIKNSRGSDEHEQRLAHDFGEDDGTVRIPSTRLPTFASSPLAGGLLTDRFRNCRPPVQVPNATGREQRQRRRHFNILQDYATRRRSAIPDCERSASEEVVWGEYLTSIESIRQVSRGYVGSDTASLSLRWLLQQQQPLQPSTGQQSEGSSSASPLHTIPNVAGLVVATRFYDPTREGDVQQQMARRIKALRSVFTFRLSNEEMKHLNELSGWWTELDDRGREAKNDRTNEVVRFL